MRHINAALSLLILIAASTTSAGSRFEPVRNFNLNRFCGVWYEIARMPTPFEKDLTHVRATYTQLADGDVSVLNEGYRNGVYKPAKARMKSASKDTTSGALAISFFGPFFSDFTVVACDSSYEYAVVTSGREYGWIFTRVPVPDPALRDRLVAKLKSLGFATEKIIIVPQKAIGNATDN